MGEGESHTLTLTHTHTHTHTRGGRLTEAGVVAHDVRVEVVTPQELFEALLRHCRLNVNKQIHPSTYSTISMYECVFVCVEQRMCVFECNSLCVCVACVFETRK